MTSILFDLDGTLIDSEPHSRQAWHQLLSSHQLELPDAVYARMIGKRSIESARIVRDHFNLPYTAREILEMKSAIWERRWRQGLPTMPGLYPVLDALDARGIGWAVVTSSPRHYAEHILQHLGIRSRCQVVVGGDDVAQGKPAPDPYLLAAEQMGVAPASCWVVEDSAPGMLAGIRAGMRVLTIPGPLVEPDEIPAGVRQIDSLEQLLSLLPPPGSNGQDSAAVH